MRVAVSTLGCKLNQADSEAIEKALAVAGLQLVSFDEVADLYIVNSCSVTHVADRKSRQMARQAKRHNPAGLVVVTGCYAAVSPQSVATVAEVDAVVGKVAPRELVGHVVAMLEARARTVHPAVGPAAMETAIAWGRDAGLDEGSGAEEDETRPVARRTRRFVSIQDGCNKFCGYCIVPLARGRERGRPMREVIDEISGLVEEGCQEVVLTGVNIGAYRGEGDDGSLLALTMSILEKTDLPRLRLSSIEPEDFDPRLVSLLETGRVMPHFHLPLQSGSDQVLSRMGRHYTSARYLSLIEAIRSQAPRVAITTDVIVGLPGEDAACFEDGLAVVRRVSPAAVHVFKYSKRKGTRAAAMDGQVDEAEKQRRSRELIALAKELGNRYRDQFVGEALSVLYEQNVDGDGTLWEGVSENYLNVVTRSSEALSNRVRATLISRCGDAGLVGKLV